MLPLHIGSLEQSGQDAAPGKRLGNRLEHIHVLRAGGICRPVGLQLLHIHGDLRPKVVDRGNELQQIFAVLEINHVQVDLQLLPLQTFIAVHFSLP